MFPQEKDIRGVEGRNDIGFLLWDKDEETTAEYNLGSRDGRRTEDHSIGAYAFDHCTESAHNSNNIILAIH